MLNYDGLEEHVVLGFTSDGSAHDGVETHGRFAKNLGHGLAKVKGEEAVAQGEKRKREHPVENRTVFSSTAKDDDQKPQHGSPLQRAGCKRGFDAVSGAEVAWLGRLVPGFGFSDRRTGFRTEWLKEKSPCPKHHFKRVSHEVDILDGEVELRGEIAHPGKVRKCLLALAQCKRVVGNEPAQNFTDRLDHEHGIPVDVDERRDAHAAEEESLPRKPLNVEAKNHVFGVLQKLLGFRKIRLSEIFFNGVVCAASVFKNFHCRKSIEFDPHWRAIEKCQSPEPVPAAGLAPDGDADHICGPLQVSSQSFELPSVERWKLAGPLVFAAGLKLDNFWKAGPEELLV